jgi:hypothetical protein
MMGTTSRLVSSLVLASLLAGCVNHDAAPQGRAASSAPGWLVVPSDIHALTPYSLVVARAALNLSETINANITDEERNPYVKPGVVSAASSIQERVLEEARQALENESFPTATVKAEEALLRTIGVATGNDRWTPEEATRIMAENNTTLPREIWELAGEINATRANVSNPGWEPLLRVERAFFAVLEIYDGYTGSPWGDSPNPSNIAYVRTELTEARTGLDYVRSLPPPPPAALNMTRVKDEVLRAREASRDTTTAPNDIEARDLTSPYGLATRYWPYKMNQSIALGWPELTLEFALGTQAWANVTRAEVAQKTPTNDDVNATLASVEGDITPLDFMDEALLAHTLDVLEGYNEWKAAEGNAPPPAHVQTDLIHAYAWLEAIPVIHAGRVAAIEASR